MKNNKKPETNIKSIQVDSATGNAICLYTGPSHWRYEFDVFSQFPLVVIIRDLTISSKLYLGININSLAQKQP